MSNNQLQDTIQELISDRLKHNLEDQVAAATKAVSQIERVDSHQAYLKIQDKLLKEDKYKRFITIVTRAAAILFVPLLVASGILFFRQQPNNIQHFAMQEIKTPSGVRSQVVLPDGTHVWLNAESTIKFKVPFDQRSRDVILQGEAFFDVFKDPDIPFIVNSGSVSVKVLGTRFNCKAYADEQHLEVVLAEGKVSLNTNGNQIGDAVIMKPGDRAVYDKTTNQTSFTNGSVAKYIEWHNGKLIFDETPMPEVAIELGRWFGVEILINDAQIRNYKLTTTFENESLHQILELIKLSSPVEVQYVAATINKANLKQTKARVIFSKKTTN